MILTNSLLHPRIAEGRPETTEIHSDALLQASRRLDWRFLLPDPDLGLVAYLGPAQGALVESLRLFSASLTVIEMSQAHSEPAARYDVVVTTEPSYETLREAANWVRAGGFLYAEAYGLFQAGRLLRRTGRHRLSLKGPRLCYPADYVVALERLGFTEIQAHWHWPDFESCTKIIPLENHMALHYIVDWGGRNAKARLKSVLGRCLLRSGLLVRLVPFFSIVARQGAV